MEPATNAQNGLFSRPEYEARIQEENGEKQPGRSIADLLKGRPLPQKQKHRSERGDLITYFHERVFNKQGKRFPIAFIATKLSHLSVQDLYYLKSKCSQESNRTFKDKKTGKDVPITFGMVFWLELKAK